jgi:high affinity sulfate transporter 1
MPGASGQRDRRNGHISQYVPAAVWLPRITRQTVGRDVLAAVTVAAVVIPQALAYATLAGLPVQYGLYVSFIPMLAYSFFGTSRVLSVSTTSTISILTASAVAGVAASGADDYATATATLAVVTGCVLLAAGFLQLGVLGDFISLPVLAGFKVGTGLVIAASQLGKVLGVPVTGGDFFAKVWSAVTQLEDADGPTVALAAATIALLLVIRGVSARIPGPLVAVVLGIVVVGAFDLAEHGVAVVPPVPSGLPGFSVPDWSLVVDLLPAAAGIALMCFVESSSAARTYARRSDVPPLDANQELRALGTANLAGGLFRAFPAGGGLSQTTVNAQNGAQSQLAGAVTAGCTILILLFLTSLFDNLAEATLGAIVLVAVSGLIDTTTIRRTLMLRRRDGLLAVAAVVGILVLGVLHGIIVAVLLSLSSLMWGVNHLPLRVLGRQSSSGAWRDLEAHPHDEVLPGLLVIRPEGPLYFANARRMTTRLLTLVEAMHDAPRVLVVDASASPDWETTALTAIGELDVSLQEHGIDLWLCALTPRPLEMLRRSDLAQQFEGRLFTTLDSARTHYQDASP